MKKAKEKMEALWAQKKRKDTAKATYRNGWRIEARKGATAEGASRCRGNGKGQR